ncbi:DUF6266 family protein [Pedobacter ginsengisoli]|uniref:DUF6266 family protein n=1 Tax=Pedobacter ginsengisoli TaxID=363852 RepID=UPI00254FECFC|nr:DUF6266 family protein [Pedobacter ginsengisoli]
MGQLKNGPFSGFTGRTGSLVGYRKFGKWVMAAVRATASREPSLLQSYTIMRFTMMVEWLGWASDFIDIGYQNYASEMSPMNAAVKYNLEHAVAGVAPAYSIDYPNVLLSRGRLALANQLVMATTVDAQLDFTWTANIGTWKGAVTDDAAFIVYNPSKQLFVMSIGVVTRAALSFDMVLPSQFSGDNVHVYMAFVSADGKSVSTSEYVGATVVM